MFKNVYDYYSRLHSTLEKQGWTSHRKFKRNSTDEKLKVKIYAKYLNKRGIN